MADRCETCRFSIKTLGWLCRRYPPEYRNGSKHPVPVPVNSHDWCGEHQPKDNPQ